ncbi:MAG: PilN domain-containing protein [bacterium]|nr:MAG: PilN domain-containing protein [bacterium]
MIKINLLPVREERRKLGARQETLLFFLVIILIFIGVFYWHTTTNKKIRTLRREIIRVDGEIKRLAKVVAEVEKFKKDKKTLEGKIEVIGQLKRHRQAQTHFMDELNKALTPQIWLKTYQEKGGGVILKGRSLATDDIANFMRNLEASRYFNEVELEVTTQKEEKVGQTPLKINDFSIRFKTTVAPE